MSDNFCLGCHSISSHIIVTCDCRDLGKIQCNVFFKLALSLSRCATGHCRMEWISSVGRGGGAGVTLPINEEISKSWSRFKGNVVNNHLHLDRSQFLVFCTYVLFVYLERFWICTKVITSEFQKKNCHCLLPCSQDCVTKLCLWTEKHLQNR